MSRGRPQGDCCREWRLRIAGLVTRARALESVPPALLSRPRHDGGWSAAQVLEHLVLGSESYLAVMRQRVEASPASPGGSTFAWRPRLGGRLLVRSMTSSSRLPAPRVLRPGPLPRPEAVAAFTGELHELDALLTRAESMPWNGIRFGSPVSAWFRLNFGDGCLILVTHAERHFGQIDRVLEEAGRSAPA